MNIELDCKVAEILGAWPLSSIDRYDDGCWIRPLGSTDTSPPTRYNQPNTTGARQIVSGTLFSPSSNWLDFGFVVDHCGLDVRFAPVDDKFECTIVVHYRDVADQKRHTSVKMVGNTCLEAACCCFIASRQVNLQGTQANQGICK